MSVTGDRATGTSVDERPGSRESPREDGAETELPLPVGTLFLMMLYIMILAGMWGAIYFEFIGR